MKRIHIGCSLSHSPGEFRNKVNVLKALIIRNGFSVVDGMGWRERCDLYVAILDYPSTVVGVEIVRMSEQGVKVIAALHDENTSLPDVLLGDPAITAIVHYRDLPEDVMRFIMQIAME